MPTLPADPTQLLTQVGGMGLAAYLVFKLTNSIEVALTTMTAAIDKNTAATGEIRAILVDRRQANSSASDSHQ